MFGIRASQTLARAALRPTTALSKAAATRSLTVSASRKADLVQDMYLRELKGYKAPALKANDAEGQVHKFAMPAAPKSPEEADLQQDLSAYEKQVPEVEGQGSAEAAAAGGEKVQDWFDESVFEEEEAAHH